MAIIGVVAALTIPTVITNYQKKMYVTQLKKSYNNLTNAFRTIMANDGVTKLSDTTLWSKLPSGLDGFLPVDMLQPKNAEFKNEFFKTFKVAAIYGPDNFPEEYNIQSKIKYLNGKLAEDNSIDQGLYLADGTFLFFALFKTPQSGCPDGCSTLKEFQETRNTKTKLYSAVASLVLDVNGPKGPNVVGRDLFLYIVGDDGMLYPYGGADYAVCNSSGCKYENLESCSDYWKNESGYAPCTKSSDGTGCAARIMEEGWEMRY